MRRERLEEYRRSFGGRKAHGRLEIGRNSRRGGRQLAWPIRRERLEGYRRSFGGRLSHGGLEIGRNSRRDG